MLHLYLDLVPDSYSATTSVIEHVQSDYVNSKGDIFEDLEKPVWAEMKKSDKLPDFSAIYIKIVNKLGKELFEEVLPDADISFSSCGDIYIDGTKITCAADFDDMVMKYEEEDEDED